MAADDIVIDKQLFHERLGSLVTKWKADKRSGDAVFQGAGSIAAVVGKPSEPGSYLKPAAFQVSATRWKLRRRVLTTIATALVARLRVSPHTVHPYARCTSDCHHQEEG
jgi:hypothetical protein